MYYLGVHVDGQWGYCSSDCFPQQEQGKVFYLSYNLPINKFREILIYKV